MDRARSLVGWKLLSRFTVVALLAASGGCANVLATAMYVFDGTDAQADFDGLKDKRVVVVCRPPAALGYDSNANVAGDLAKQVGILLKRNVRKIKLIDQQEVAVWTDENTWDSFPEIGRALKADLVVGIDLEDFALYEGQTLFQGKANYQIRVYDMSDGSVVYEHLPPQSIWPPNTGIPTQEMQEPEFRRRFVAELAEEIGWHFYDHDSKANFAADAAAFKEN